MTRRPNDPWEFSLLRPLPSGSLDPLLPNPDDEMNDPGPLLRPSSGADDLGPLLRPLPEAPQGAAPPAEQQVALEWYERAATGKKDEKDIKSILSTLTDGAFTPKEINTIYGQVLKTIPRKEAESFLGIDPNSNPMTLTPDQLKIINDQINVMKDPFPGELKDRVQKALQESLARGRIVAP